MPPAYPTPRCPQCDTPFEILSRELDKQTSLLIARCPTCGAEGSSPIDASLLARASRLRPGSAGFLAYTAAVLDACHHAHVGKG